MSKRHAEDQVPIISTEDNAPDMVDVAVTAHARTSHQWKKQRFNKKGSENGDDDNVKVSISRDGQAIPDNLNQAELTPDAGLDATTPLRKIPYTKQLSNKKKELWKTFTGMTKDIEKGYNNTNSQLKKAYEAGHMKNYVQYRFDQPLRTKHGIGFITGPVMPSPVDMSYRNKNEFTVSYGLNKDSNEVEIGFLCGRFADGESRVGSPEGSLSCPPAFVEVTRTIKDFLNTNAVAKKYTPWIKPDNQGLIRLLTIRDCPITKQMMICLQLNPIAFTPELNYLTKANPRGDDFMTFDDETKTDLRKKHIAEREANEVKNLQSEAMEEFSMAFRDFCVENFYGGAIWHQGVTNPHTKETFVPPHDTYDLVTPDSPDLAMAVPPSLEAGTANQYVNKNVYKPIPTNDDEISTKGREFTTKYQYSLASLIIQSHTGVANSANDTALQECLFGSHYIYAQLCELFFRVSISSFLQVNIKAATTLYNIARHWAMSPIHDFNMTVEQAELQYVSSFEETQQRYYQHLWDKDIYKTSVTPTTESEYDPNSLIIAPPKVDEKEKNILFDVCCGTGTIGLINSTTSSKVVGVDIVQSAIDDANANAALNNIDKAEFVCGKAEEVIEGILKRFPASEQLKSVAILDPPRNGLHTKVLAALRDSSLQRIVYISCNQKTLAEDCLRLCGPPSKTYQNAPFIPIVAMGVDLFPHTQHCEAVMLLERRPPGENNHIKEFIEGGI